MVFKERELLPQMTLAFSMHKQAVFLNQQTLVGVEPKPQIILTPDGEMDLFQISLTMQNSNSTFLLSNTQDDGLVISSLDKP